MWRYPALRPAQLISRRRPGHGRCRCGCGRPSRPDGGAENGFWLMDGSRILRLFATGQKAKQLAIGDHPQKTGSLLWSALD